MRAMSIRWGGLDLLLAGNLCDRQQRGSGGSSTSGNEDAADSQKVRTNPGAAEKQVILAAAVDEPSVPRARESYEGDSSDAPQDAAIPDYPPEPVWTTWTAANDPSKQPILLPPASTSWFDRPRDFFRRWKIRTTSGSSPARLT